MSDLNGLSSGHQTANSSRSRRAAGKLLNEEDRVHDRGDDVGALESRKAEIESRLLELEARLERVQRLKAQNRQQRIPSRRNRSKSTNNLFRPRPGCGLRPNRSGDGSFESPSLSLVRKPKTSPFSVLNHDSRGKHVNEMDRFHLGHDELSRPSIFGRLETERYFWDTPPGGRPERTLRNEERGGKGLARSLPTVEPIQTTSDIILDSDWPAIDRALNEIRRSLANFSEFRLNMPTNFYQQIFSKNTPCGGLDPGKPFGDNGRKWTEQPVTFAELRVRLLNMEFHIERRTREILATKVSDPEMAPKPAQKMVKFDTYGLFIDNETLKDRLDSKTSERPMLATANPVTGRAVDENSSKLEIYEKPSMEESESPNQSNQEKPTNKTAHDIISPKKLVIPKPELVDDFREMGNTDLKSTISVNAASDNDKEKTAEQSSYDRMLAILKGPTTHFEVSSSSSDDEEPKVRIQTAPAIPKPTGAQKPLVLPKPPILTATSSSAENPGKVSTSKTMMEALNEKSSDSDFFD